MRLVIARCSVDYSGRLNAHLPLATRLLVHKGDGSLLVHSDGGSYKPLNWMSPPCTLAPEEPGEEEASAGVVEVWRVTHKKTGDALRVQVPVERIGYPAEYPIKTLQVLPYFCAAPAGSEGWLLVPDGGGAQIRFDNGKTLQTPYYSDLYGWALSRAGVPAVMLGGSFSDMAMLNGFLEGPYHSPDDEVGPGLLLDGAAEDATLLVALGRRPVAANSAGSTPRQLAQALTPGPEPWMSRTGSPSPTSW